MSDERMAEIAELGRARGAELAHTVAAKANTLRALGWPDAVRQVREKAKAS